LKSQHCSAILLQSKSDRKHCAPPDSAASQQHYCVTVMHYWKPYSWYSGCIVAINCSRAYAFDAL